MTPGIPPLDPKSPSDGELAQARAAGLSDGELVEIVVLVAAKGVDRYLTSSETVLPS